MTQEQFDKAIQIHSDMNEIYALQNTLANSKNARFIAAIEVKKFDEQRIIVEECKILNHTRIPVNIMEKFEKILWEELDRLKTEFNKL